MLICWFCLGLVTCFYCVCWCLCLWCLVNFVGLLCSFAGFVGFLGLGGVGFWLIFDVVYWGLFVGFYSLLVCL